MNDGDLLSPRSGDGDDGRRLVTRTREEKIGWKSLANFLRPGRRVDEEAEIICTYILAIKSVVCMYVSLIWWVLILSPLPCPVPIFRLCPTLSEVSSPGP